MVAPQSRPRFVHGPGKDRGFGLDALQAYMAEVGRHPLLERAEEQRLARRWQQERDPDAAQRLVTANLRFVVKVALGYRKYGLPLGDVVQEGNLGLMQAVDRFDPDKGTRLISYAVWWIRAYIQNYVLRSWSMVRIGTTHTQRRLFYRLPQVTALMAGAGEDGVRSPRALAGRLGAREGDVQLMMGRLQGRDVSLDAPTGDEQRPPPLDRIADGAADPEQVTAEREHLSRRLTLLHCALDTLPPRERVIVEQRHLSDEPRTLQEVGDQLGLSRERVRQLEGAALARLRQVLVADAA